MTFIIDPITKQKFLLNSKKGKSILKKYINHYNSLKKQLKGGANQRILNEFMQIIENFKYSGKHFNSEEEALDFLMKWSWKDALSLISDKEFKDPRKQAETLAAKNQCENAKHCGVLTIIDWQERYDDSPKEWNRFIRNLKQDSLFKETVTKTLMQRQQKLKNIHKSKINCSREYINDLINEGDDDYAQELLVVLQNRVKNLNHSINQTRCYLCGELCNERNKSKNRDCEHIIPALRSIFFVGIFGNGKVMKRQLQLREKLTSKYMTFMTLLYDWAHSACNRSSGKSDILLIKFDEYRNKFIGDEENARKLYDNLVRIYKTGVFKNE